jgi:general stress protein YciG
MRGCYPLAERERTTPSQINIDTEISLFRFHYIRLYTTFTQVRREQMQGNKGRGRGFASMSPEKKREIASKGGKAAHQMGTAHKWTSEEAQAAGRKGGSISRRRPKNAAQA